MEMFVVLAEGNDSGEYPDGMMLSLSDLTEIIAVFLNLLQRFLSLYEIGFVYFCDMHDIIFAP